MPTLEEVANGVVPFPKEGVYVFYVVCFVQLIGLVLGIITLGSNVGKPNEPSAKILLSHILGGILFAVTSLARATTQYESQGFVLGVSGCLIDYFFIFTSSSVSIITLITASLERYFAVVRKQRWSNNVVNCVLVCVWAYSLASAAIPFMFDRFDSIRLDESGWYCMIKWYGRDYGSFIMTSITCCWFVFGFTIVSFSYTSVYFSFRNALKTRQRINQSSLDNEKKVFQMCLLLTISFVGFWTPIFCNILYEVVTGAPIPYSMAITAASIASLSYITNPLVLIYFDNRIRGNVLRFTSFLCSAPSSSLHPPSAHSEPTIEPLEIRTKITSIDSTHIMNTACPNLSE
jgi:hypothetical protein